MAVDPWVHSTSKEWTATFKLARSFGWPEPKVTSSHKKYVLDCPARDPRCQIKAYGTTGASGEQAARTSRMKIRRCSHAPADLFIEVHHHIDAAQNLLEVVEKQVEICIAEAEINELFQELEMHFEEAEDLLQRYCIADDKRIRLREELEAEGMKNGATKTPQENSNKARRELSMARDRLKELQSDHPTWADLSQKVTWMRNRFKELGEVLVGLEK